MKKLFLISVLALTGCGLLGPTYTGETTADNLLKSDTEKSINLIFRALHSCHPEKIHTKIESIPKPNTAEETWMATGCGHTENFKVSYIPDGVGGTFIRIRR